MKFFSYDPNGEGLVFHKTAEAAQETADQALEGERDMADEGWAENVGEICWGRVMAVAKECSNEPAPEGSEFEAIVDYDLEAVDENE